MSNKAKRVALLSRPGAAEQRLAEVLGEAGVDLVLRADPTQVEAATVLGAHPDTVLVALDPPTEDALDRLDDALYAPSVDVIYEEAALVVAREGWDAARWRRHLLAKLQGHGDVLPPVQSEAVANAQVLQPTFVEPVAETLAPIDALEQPFTTFSISQSFEAVGEPLLDAPAQPVPVLPAEPEPVRVPSSITWTLDAGPVDAATPDIAAGLGELTLAQDDAPTVPAPEQANATPGFSLFDPVAAESSDAAVSPAVAERWADQAFVAEPAAAEDSADDRFNNDLASLELRIASMSLVDETPVRGPEKIRGAILVLAGIGGPDAVRQFLGSLPTDFVRPVLVQQRLDGARYDRLVAQMQRATALPVKLAEVAQPVEQGTVYIMPDDVGVQDAGNGLVFHAGANDIMTALPAADSAVLMLSGSDPARVDAALSFGWNGGLVLGQNADGCYDAAAVTDLCARGGAVAKPAEMGARLATHWQRGA